MKGLLALLVLTLLRPPVIPEPETYVLMLAGLAAAARRRKTLQLAILECVSAKAALRGHFRFTPATTAFSIAAPAGARSLVRLTGRLPETHRHVAAAAPAWQHRPVGAMQPDRPWAARHAAER